MANYSIYCPIELREQVWLKAGHEPNNLKERYSLSCDEKLWQSAQAKSGYISMSRLMRTLWQMWLDGQVVIEGFNGFITITDLTTWLLTMYVNDEIEINREDWVR